MASASHQPQVTNPAAVNNDRPVLFLVLGRGLLAAIIGPFFFVRIFVIPTGSMENTVLIGDRILVRVFPKETLKRNDIVVFRFPYERKLITIKRLIGMPGDRLRIVSKVVYRNGDALKEPYAVHQFDGTDDYRDNFPRNPVGHIERLNPEALAGANEMFENHVIQGEVVVPAGKYFVLGDNRDNSLDSRYWGFVNESDVVGRPVLILYSLASSEGGDGGKLTIHPDRFLKGF